MNEPKFKIGDYVKQNPVGIVKKIIETQPPDKDNNHDKSHWYKLEDSFGWEPEFKLVLSKEENLSLSHDKSQQKKIDALEKELQAEREKSEQQFDLGYKHGVREGRGD